MMPWLQAIDNFISPSAYASPGESYYNQAAAYTKQNEGFRSTPYQDTQGQPTIGYGFNMQAHPGLPSTMTQSQADPLFMKYFQDADSLAMKFAGPRWGSLTDAQKAVLTDMAYNLNNKLFGFDHMHAALQAGDNAGVQREIKNSRWYHQVKGRGVSNVNKWGKK